MVAIVSRNISGEGTEGFPKGAPVIALTRFGSMAEYVVAPASRCYRMPQGMSFEDGAALLLNYVTAYLILFHVVSIKKDKIALIHSAGGGVGCACAQLCNLLENVTLIGTASKGKHEQLRKMSLYTYLFDRYQEGNSFPSFCQNFFHCPKLQYSIRQLHCVPNFLPHFSLLEGSFLLIFLPQWKLKI